MKAAGYNGQPMQLLAKEGSVSMTVERTGAAPLTGDQQSVKLLPLFARHVAGKDLPVPAPCPAGHTRDGARHSRVNRLGVNAVAASVSGRGA